MITPKVFISYSWTSESHRELVRDWADRLLADGVSIVLDQYDLKEGHDKNAFMEKMVTDSSVTHVLFICDKTYAEKADARKAGVGTESQIISQEVYAKVEQSKFIPIVCELSAEGDPYLPAFIRSRIWINFSSPEKVNENWEQLVRLLFGKPAYQKPSVGNPPLYIIEDNPSPANPAISRFATFKQAVLQGKKGIAAYRSDFLEACFQYIDILRVRQQPNVEHLGKQVLEDCGKLIQARNLIADWVMLEAGAPHENQFEDALSMTLEKLLELRTRPTEINCFNDAWFEAHRLFAYETFLYILAALLKANAFTTMNGVFTQGYLAPESESSSNDRFVRFDAFYAHSQTLNEVLAPPGQRLLSPAGTLIKQQATRVDIPFKSIMEVDLLALLSAALGEHMRWYPQTLVYAGYGALPFFLRASQHKHFKKLTLITASQSADELRTKVKAGFERMNTNQWSDFSFHANVSFWAAANMEQLDSID